MSLNVNKIREDFPALHQKINGKPVIYFDNACMTLKSRQVIDAINEYYTKYPACHGRSTPDNPDACFIKTEPVCSEKCAPCFCEDKVIDCSNPKYRACEGICTCRELCEMLG